MCQIKETPSLVEKCCWSFGTGSRLLSQRLDPCTEEEAERERIEQGVGWKEPIRQTRITDVVSPAKPPRPLLNALRRTAYQALRRHHPKNESDMEACRDIARKMTPDNAVDLLAIFSENPDFLIEDPGILVYDWPLTVEALLTNILREYLEKFLYVHINDLSDELNDDV